MQISKRAQCNASHLYTSNNFVELIKLISIISSAKPKQNEKKDLNADYSQTHLPLSLETSHTKNFYLEINSLIFLYVYANIEKILRKLNFQPKLHCNVNCYRCKLFFFGLVNLQIVMFELTT